MGACWTKKLDGSSFAILQQHGKLARFDNTVAEVREAMIKQDKQKKQTSHKKRRSFNSHPVTLTLISKSEGSSCFVVQTQYVQGCYKFF